MTIDNINVEETVKKVTDLIAQEKNLSPALKGSLEVMLLLISILVNRLGLNSRKSSKLIPEGRFVTVFNPKVEAWLLRKWTIEDLEQIRADLAPVLHIPLTEQGFAQAADRAMGKNKKIKDDTNYDAVWVRDSMWIYQALKIDRKKDARRILLAIWDYYASQA